MKKENHKDIVFYFVQNVIPEEYRKKIINHDSDNNSMVSHIYNEWEKYSYSFESFQSHLYLHPDIKKYCIDIITVIEYETETIDEILQKIKQINLFDESDIQEFKRFFYCYKNKPFYKSMTDSEKNIVYIFSFSSNKNDLFSMFQFNPYNYSLTVKMLILRKQNLIVEW